MLGKLFSRLSTVITAIITVMFIGTVAGSLGAFYAVYYFSRDLPDYSQLAEYSPPTVTRLYAADGRIIEEYAKERRLFVPINAIPKRLVNAFIAAEDKNFYSHPGVDFVSIIRAAVKNLSNFGKNKSLVGGSTITQQVVKNFLLTNEKSFTRKAKEAILAFRITQAFSKDKIMELYLNEIYLGNRSYGVAAAALNYFDKSIAELTIEEAAMLASLPKAPSSLDPRKFPERAKERRDWVISRMEGEGFINEVDAVLATAKEIIVADRNQTEIVANAEFFAEAVRQELEGIYGEEGVYESGLAVRTTLDPRLQTYAEKALKKGLLAYDKRHGYRGPLAHIDEVQDWKKDLDELQEPLAIGNWTMAMVLEVADKSVKIGLKGGEFGEVPLKYMVWAKKYIDENEQGRSIKKPGDVLAVNDIILVRNIKDDSYFLEQVPQISGGIVAMDPHTGRVLALVGGYYYGESQFNRATQAKRQPGSSFKPFVYLAALENGFAPNSIIIDEEVQLGRGEDLPGWRPQNYSGKYYGPTTLRVGIEKSRNTMTVRLSQLMGISKVVEIAKRFGINDHPDRNFSVALGSAETDLLSLTNAYAMLVNGGKKIEPSLIERIQGRHGKTIYKHDNRDCKGCIIANADETDEDILQIPPLVLDQREQIADPIAAYQTVSLLEGVVQRGTGKRTRDLGYTLAGKTGTTNDSVDTWFMGFSADLAVGVYVGFDTPKSLGKYETGASASLPIWKDFMKHALKGEPDIPFRRADGIKLVKIDAKTGLLPAPGTPKHNIIYEAFRAGTEPTSSTAGVFTPTSEDGIEVESNFNSGEVY